MSLDDELGEMEEKEVEEEQGGERQEKEEEEEVEEDDSMEMDTRNTDSVFSELSELSRDYVESVDQGACVRGKLIRKSCFKSFYYESAYVISFQLTLRFINI